MFLNLTALRAELISQLKAPSNTPTSSLDLWLNLAQDDIATDLDPEHLTTPFTFSTAVGVRKYYLDQIEFLKILSMQHPARLIDLEEVDMSDIEQRDPNYIHKGTSYLYSLYGYEYIRLQPTTSNVAVIVSSSASDITQKVRINGLVNGFADTELLSLNGTNPVTGSKTWDAGSNTVLSIFSVAKSDTSVGVITTTIGPDTISSIPAKSYIEERQPIYLWPEPTAVNVMQGRCIRRPRKMVNAEDFPDFPPAFHEAILLGGVVRGHINLFRVDMASKVKNSIYKDALEKLKDTQGNTRGKFAPIIKSESPRLSSPLTNVRLPVG